MAVVFNDEHVNPRRGTILLFFCQIVDYGRRMVKPEEVKLEVAFPPVLPFRRRNW